MNISWHGEGTIKIQTGDTSVLIDPAPKSSGLSPLRSHVDIVCLGSRKDHDNIEHIKDPNLVIDEPGEYESRGIGIEAIESAFGAEKNESAVFYVLNMEDMNICHLGPINKELDQKQIDAIGDVDILLLPCGGSDVLDTKKAVELSNELEPRIVIPLYYNISGLKTKRTDLAGFLKEIGASGKETERTLSIKKHQLPQEETQIRVLEKM